MIGSTFWEKYEWLHILAKNIIGSKLCGKNMSGPTFCEANIIGSNLCGKNKIGSTFRE
jgi:uncharacterized protein YjbI with pentapeptide repeats